MITDLSASIFILPTTVLPSVRPSVCPSVHPSSQIRPSSSLSSSSWKNLILNWLFRKDGTKDGRKEDE